MIDSVLYIFTNFEGSLAYSIEQCPVVFYALYISFSATIGSFLACCAYRIPRKISLLNPKRSYCPKCETELKSSDLVPVISYLALGGKCRYCKNKISAKYFAIELVTILIFLGILIVI